MKKRTATLFLIDPGDLNKPPHVLSQFLDAIMGDGQLYVDQQVQRWEHLAQCIHCQAFLGSYLVKVIEYNKEHGEPEDSAQKLLIQLKHIIHERLKEDISRYVEMLIDQGEEEASRRFPEFAEHLQACRDCYATVQDLRSWLTQL